MANAESLTRSSGFIVPFSKGQSLQWLLVNLLRRQGGEKIGNALLVGLDMTDLAAVGAFALGSCYLCAVGRGVAC